MVFSPASIRTKWESLIICIWIVIIDGLLLLWAYRRPIDWLKFALIFAVLASLPLLINLAYRTWQALTLEYWVDRNAVTIRWANARQIIPMGEIKRVVQGGLDDLGQPRWIHWPADNVRHTQVLGLLDVRMLASKPLEQCILIETNGGVFAISPEDETAFLEALQSRYQFGPARLVELEHVHTTSLGDFLGHNPASWLLLGIGLFRRAGADRRADGAFPGAAGRNGHASQQRWSAGLHSQQDFALSAARDWLSRLVHQRRRRLVDGGAQAADRRLYAVGRGDRCADLYAACVGQFDAINPPCGRIDGH